MSGKQIKDKLAAGQTVFGTFLHYVTSPDVADVLSDQALDFVVLSTEHSARHMTDFVGLGRALSAKGIASPLRIHTRDPEDVAKACDAFPDGVVIPYVEDVEQAKRLVAAAKYRPLKGQALEKLITSGEWPSQQSWAYIQDKCANTLCCLMIESVQAIENLEAICSIEGVDVVFVGPNDLTVSMGIPEERDDQRFYDALARIVQIADKHGVAAGAHLSKLSHARRLIELGGRFIPFSGDMSLFRDVLPQWFGLLRGQDIDREDLVI